MAAVPLSQACGPSTVPRAALPAFGSPYLRLHPGYRRYAVKRRARLQDLCARGGRPGVEASPAEDVQSNFGTRLLKKRPGTQKISKSRDTNVIFVAGATGRVGSRVVRELLKLGFRVRAGVRNLEKAQSLLELAAELKAEREKKRAPGFFSAFSPKLFNFRAPGEDKPIELVECDLESRGGLEAALGNAGVVVCSIGASEKEVLDVTGPYRIDYQATANLIEAATEAKVNHFILVTSLGTTKIGWPATALNLFWGVLIWKAKAEKRLEESGLPFTIIRPGGMERPTDAYKETHNLFLAKADTFSGSQVSNLQVAELIASVVNNFELSENKVIEAIADTSAPLRPIEDMLAEIPVKAIPPSTKVAREAVKEADVEENKADRRSERERKQELRERLKYELAAAKEQEKKARIEAETAVQEKAAIERKVSELRLKAEAASLAARQAKALQEALTVAAKEGRLLTDEEKQKLVASVTLEAEKQIQETKPQPDVSNLNITENKPTDDRNEDTSTKLKSSTKKRFRWPWEPEAAIEQSTAATTVVEQEKEVEEPPLEKVVPALEVQAAGVVKGEQDLAETTTELPRSDLAPPPLQNGREEEVEVQQAVETPPVENVLPEATKLNTKKRFRWPWEPEAAIEQSTAATTVVEQEKDVEESPSEKVVPALEVQAAEVVKGEQDLAETTTELPRPDLAPAPVQNGLEEEVEVQQAVETPPVENVLPEATKLNTKKRFRWPWEPEAAIEQSTAATTVVEQEEDVEEPPLDPPQEKDVEEAPSEKVVPGLEVQAAEVVKGEQDLAETTTELPRPDLAPPPLQNGREEEVKVQQAVETPLIENVLPEATKLNKKKRFRWPWEPEAAIEQSTAATTVVEQEEDVEEPPSDPPQEKDVEEVPSEEVVPALEVQAAEVVKGEQDLAETTTEPPRPDLAPPPVQNGREEEVKVQQAVETPLIENVLPEATKLNKKKLFRWPWEPKAGTVATSEPETTQPETLDSNVTVLPEETNQEASIPSPPARPQSPYARYPDFKPPTSPSPRPPQQLLPKSAEEKEPKISNGPLQAPTRPLSPYSSYPDLRPPASSSPSTRQLR